MDTSNKKHTILRAITLAACSLLLAGACDNYIGDGMEPDIPANEVPLNFSASIEKTETAQSRSFIPTENLPQGAYSFGLSITKSENGSEPFKGSSDMIAKTNSFTHQWNFYDNSNQAPITPVGPEGKALKVVAYHPLVSSATKDVYTNGIPFDFSSKTDLKQTDLLYNAETIYHIPSGDAPAIVPIKFRHAYTWIVLNITKYVNKGPECMLNSVSLDNLGGSWIKNKGSIDPETGLAKDGAIAGPIGVTVDPAVALSTTEVRTYEFLVPSFMDTKVGDGEIVLVLNVNGINELFTLDKAYLNRSDDGKSFGFRQGYKNTYDLVYNNSALSLSIQNWSSEVINGDFGGNTGVPGAGNYMWLDLASYYWPTATKPGDPFAKPYPPKSTYLATGVHPFEDYLTTVAYGGNGAYVSVNTPNPSTLPTDGLKITDDINVYTNEKVYPIIHITKYDISIVPVPWADENGQLAAKELCKKYNGGGFHNWRLPRASELRAVLVLVSANGGALSDLNFNQDENRNKLYWTGTEVNESEVWGMYIDYTGVVKTTTVVLSPYDKKMEASVRCVRDASQ